MICLPRALALGYGTLLRYASIGFRRSQPLLRLLTLKKCRLLDTWYFRNTYAARHMLQRMVFIFRLFPTRQAYVCHAFRRCPRYLPIRAMRGDGERRQAV